MSSLLDRYINAVERHLPQAQRQDIGAELREMIQSRMDEEAAAHGRGLTPAEQAAILKSVGRPVLVASRYGTAQHLIGPSMYPYYVSTLKTLATIGLPLLVIATVVGALGSDNPLLGAIRVVGRAFNLTWVAFGVVTFIFWQMERAAPKPNFDEIWDPAQLPELPVKEPNAIPRAASISHAAFLLVYLLWWTDVLPLSRLLGLIAWSGSYTTQLSPVWQGVSVGIALLIAFELGLQLLNIWRPVVPKWRLVLHIAGDLAALGVIYYLLQAQDLVTMPAGGALDGQQDRINDAARLGLLGLSVLIALGTVFDEGKRLLGFGPVFEPRDTPRLVRAMRGARWAGVRPPRTNGGTGTTPR